MMLAFAPGPGVVGNLVPPETGIFEDVLRLVQPVRHGGLGQPHAVQAHRPRQGGPLLHGQGIHRHMRRLQRNRPVQRAPPGFRAGARAAGNQVEPDVLEARFTGMRDGNVDVSRRVPPAEDREPGVIEGLRADAKPVCPGGLQHAQRLHGGMAGIRLHAPFRDAARGQDRAHPAGQLAQQAGLQEGGRAAAQVNGFENRGRMGVQEQAVFRPDRGQPAAGERGIVTRRIEGAIPALAVAERHMDIEAGDLAGHVYLLGNSVGRVGPVGPVGQVRPGYVPARAFSSSKAVSGIASRPKPRPSLMSGVMRPW